MNILTFETDKALNQAGANIIISLLHTRPKAVLGLATGSSPIGIYKELIAAYNDKRVSFRQAFSFNLDEYVGLAEGHPQSYRTFMDNHLFEHIDFSKERIHIPDGNALDLDEKCARYDEKIEHSGRIDLQILGIGHNGHIGFNEPANELQSGTHLVQLDQRTREANSRFFQSIDEVPTHAVTMGIGSIMKSKMVLLVAKGADKADILHQALTGPITTQCPASFLQAHPHLVVLTDQQSGRKF